MNKLTSEQIEEALYLIDLDLTFEEMHAIRTALESVGEDYSKFPSTSSLLIDMLDEDSEMLFHECSKCNCRCNCSNQPCSCCI